MQTTVDDLSALEAPEAAQAGHEEVVASFEDLSSKLADVSSAVDAEDQQAAQQAVVDLQNSVSDFLQQFTSGLTKIAASRRAGRPQRGVADAVAQPSSPVSSLGSPATLGGGPHALGAGPLRRPAATEPRSRTHPWP